MGGKSLGYSSINVYNIKFYIENYTHSCLLYKLSRNLKINSQCMGFLPINLFLCFEVLKNCFSLLFFMV